MSSRSAGSPGDPSPGRRARSAAATGGFVILDKAWAERLGVQRVSGVHRISRRELALRLATLRQAWLEQPIRLDGRPERPDAVDLPAVRRSWSASSSRSCGTQRTADDAGAASQGRDHCFLERGRELSSQGLQETAGQLLVVYAQRPEPRLGTGRPSTLLARLLVEDLGVVRADGQSGCQGVSAGRCPHGPGAALRHCCCWNLFGPAPPAGYG
jgi:hypothetical protein